MVDGVGTDVDQRVVKYTRQRSIGVLAGGRMGKDRGDTITRELHPSLARRVGNPSHVPSPLRTVTDANSPQSAVQPAQWSFQMPSSLRFGTFDQNNPVTNNPLTAIEVFFVFANGCQLAETKPPFQHCPDFFQARAASTPSLPSKPRPLPMSQSKRKTSLKNSHDSPVKTRDAVEVYSLL